MREENPPKRRVRLSTASCPECGAKGALKRILWGLPDSDIDLSKYVIGGCLVSDSDPEIACEKCDWAGMRSDLLREDKD